MGDNIFAQFNEMFDVNGLKDDIASAADKNFERVEVPDGSYEVAVTKIELGVTGENAKNPGMPKANIWFKILAGEYKGQMLFCNQMLTTGFGIHKCNEMLNAFESGIPVTFENFEQYAHEMDEVFKAIDGVGEYELAYGHNKGFPTYTIVQRFNN